MQCICIDSVLFKGKNYYNVEDVLITYSKQSEHLGMMDMKRFLHELVFWQKHSNAKLHFQSSHTVSDLPKRLCCIFVIRIFH